MAWEDDIVEDDWTEEPIMNKWELWELILQLSDKDYKWIKDKINSSK